MTNIYDIKRVVERTIDMLGGYDNFKQVSDAEFKDMKHRWDLDTVRIGRILRSHLYTEYYLTRHIEKANPRLGDLSNGRLTFSQKISLLDTKEKHFKELTAGLRQINSIRNRLAHRLDAVLTESDVQVFLSNKMFNAIRVEAAKPNTPSPEPIDILEKYAQYAAHLLANEFSKISIALSKAIRHESTQND